MSRADVEHISSALSNVGHISITGAHQERGGGKGQFGIIYGLTAIADYLARALVAPALFESA